MGAHHCDKVMRDILLEDIKTDIMMAREGLISSEGIQQRLLDMKYASEEGLLSELECIIFADEFKTAADSAATKNNQEDIKRCMNETGGKVLYCREGPGESVVFLSQGKRGYLAIAYLDIREEKAMVSQAKKCVSDLKSFAADHNLFLSSVSELKMKEWTPPNCIPTLEEAISYLITELEDAIKRL